MAFHTRRIKEEFLLTAEAEEFLLRSPTPDPRDANLADINAAFAIIAGRPIKRERSSTRFYTPPSSPVVPNPDDYVLSRPLSRTHHHGDSQTPPAPHAPDQSGPLDLLLAQEEQKPTLRRPLTPFLDRVLRTPEVHSPLPHEPHTSPLSKSQFLELIKFTKRSQAPAIAGPSRAPISSSFSHETIVSENSVGATSTINRTSTPSRTKTTPETGRTPTRSTHARIRTGGKNPRLQKAVEAHRLSQKKRNPLLQNPRRAHHKPGPHH